MPGEFEQLVATGSHHLLGQNYPKAREALLAAYKINRRDTRVLVGLAFCCVNDSNPEASQKFEAAVTYLKEALELNPDDVGAKQALSWVRFMMRSFPDTIAICRSILVDDPKHLEASCYLGLALIGTDQLDEAERILLDVVGRSPTNVEARLGLAIIKGDRGHPEEFAKEFNEIMVVESKELGTYAWSLLSVLKPSLTEAFTKWAKQKGQAS